MILTLERIARKTRYTIGRLYVDGVRFCDTLEDPDRGLRQDMPIAEIRRRKVYGDTAIPTGVYKVDMNTVSPKLKDKYYAKPYGGILPRLLGIPGYSGVLIHPGNTQKDTLGCLLVGRNTAVGRVTQSAATFMKLMNEHLIPARDRGEEITIEIK